MRPEHYGVLEYFVTNWRRQADALRSFCKQRDNPFTVSYAPQKSARVIIEKRMITDALVKIANEIRAAWALTTAGFDLSEVCNALSDEIPSWRYRRVIGRNPGSPHRPKGGRYRRRPQTLAETVCGFGCPFGCNCSQNWRKVAGMDENRIHPGRLTAPRKRF